MTSMAGISIPTGYGQWTFEMQHAGLQHTSFCTMGFKVLTPPYTQANTSAALTGWANAIKTLHDNEVTYSRCVALIGNDGPLIRFEATGSVVGTRTTLNILPPNVTYLMRKTTAFSGRRYRGRLYIPYVASGASAVSQAGQLASGEMTLLAAACTSLITNLVTGGTNCSELDVLHAPGDTALPSPTPIVAMTADDFVATQRRRLTRS